MDNANSEADGNVRARVWHPWLRIQRVLLGMLALHRDKAALTKIEPEIKQVLAVRDRVRRAGWFN